MVPAGPLGVRGGEVIALLFRVALVRIVPVVMAWKIARKILGTVMDNHWRKR